VTSNDYFKIELIGNGRAAKVTTAWNSFFCKMIKLSNQTNGDIYFEYCEIEKIYKQNRKIEAKGGLGLMGANGSISLDFSKEFVKVMKSVQKKLTVYPGETIPRVVKGKAIVNMYLSDDNAPNAYCLETGLTVKAGQTIHINQKDVDKARRLKKDITKRM